MIDHLQQVLQHVQQESDKLSADQQEALANIIAQIPIPLPPFAGSMPDLPDDIEEEMLRRRREVPPTPPMDEQLRDLLEDDE